MKVTKNSRKYRLAVTICVVLCVLFTALSTINAGSLLLPEPAVLGLDNPDNAGNYTVIITNPAGNTATFLYLYENYVMVFSKKVKSESRTDQVFKYTIAGKPDGVYAYYVVTQNKAGKDTSADLIVTVGSEKSSPSPSPAPEASLPPMLTMFDDFNYSDANDILLRSHGWIVRSGSGGPGPGGCSWSTGNVTFLTDPDNPGNKLMGLTSSTGGAGNNTVQSEVYTSGQKYFAGTYAARVNFSDAPSAGADDAAINETFFAISPFVYDNDPNYSEIDFEYLANGGWGVFGPSMWCTSWYTYSNNPWSKDNVYNRSSTSYAGWHTLVFTVGNGEVNYYIDGNFIAKHNGKYYPRKNMLIDFNVWFLGEGPLNASTYNEKVDWVFHAKDIVLTPGQVDAQVQSYRSQKIAFTDTVN